MSVIEEETVQDFTRQSRRIKRTSMALVGALLHTLFCFLIWTMGNFKTSLLGFVALFLFFWAGNLSFLVCILLGWNRKLKEPSMTLPEVFWAVTVVLISVYFTDDVRPAVMMYVLLALSFGAFELSQKQYLFLIGYVAAAYGLILYLLMLFRPLEVIYNEELVAIGSFISVCLVFSMVVHEMASIRGHLRQKNVDLKLVSMTDYLTGVHNRRYAFSVLEQQRWLAERKQDYYFSLVMLDIDQFKTINDMHGHAIGDAVLKEICKTVLHELRKMDVLARMGGEEFLIILPLGDIDKARILAERIRTKVAEKDFSKVMPIQDVTVSLGVTLYHAGESVEDALKRVDNAMYAAKEQGRNRVVVQM